MPALPNAKHEAVIQAYIADPERIGWKAYAKVYPKSSPRAAESSWSALIRNPVFAARIAELNAVVVEKTAEAAGIDKAWVLAKLIENANRAMQAEPVVDDEGNPTGEHRYNGSVANRALELIGKELGMFVDRREVGEPGEFDRLADAELEAELVAEAKALGLTGAAKLNGTGRTRH